MIDASARITYQSLRAISASSWPAAHPACPAKTRQRAKGLPLAANVEIVQHPQ
jgi:hypothetical protein